MNKLVYLALTVYAGILAILYYGVATLYVFLLLCVFPLFLWIFLQYSKRKVKVHIQSNNTLVNQGEAIACVLVIENKGVVPVGNVRIKVSYQNQYGTKQGTQYFSTGLQAKGKQNMEFIMHSDHVGNVVIKVEKVKLFDYLKVFSTKVKVDSKTSIMVLPLIYTVEQVEQRRPMETIESDTYSKRVPGDDPSEVFDIREYKEGDKVHRIHWKLSSKNEEIFVKEYSLPITCSTGIIVDLELPKKENKYEYMDALLSSIGSISYSLLLQEHSHVLVWYEQKTQQYKKFQVGELEELYMALHELLEVQLQHEENTVLEAFEAYTGTRELQKLYYLTSNVNANKYEVLSTQFHQVQVDVIQIIKEQTIQQAEGYVEQMRNQWIGMNTVQKSIEALVL